MKPNDAAWDRWFDIQYELAKELQAKIKERTEGLSDDFRAAVCAGLIGTLAEQQRIYMSLPASDSRPTMELLHAEENCVDSDCPLHGTKEPTSYAEEQARIISDTGA